MVADVNCILWFSLGLLALVVSWFDDGCDILEFYDEEEGRKMKKKGEILCKREYIRYIV